MASKPKKPLIKSNKEVFEEQLKALQEDLSALSQNLSFQQHPASLSTPAHNLGTNGKYLDINDKHQSSQLESKILKTNEYLESQEVTRLKNESAELKRKLMVIEKEKADMALKEELLSKELEEHRKSLEEISRFKATFEALKQENESLKISLDSSERIRIQQKELISLLQKSHSIGDTASVASVKTISTIQSNNDNSTFSSVSPSIAAENRSWLNVFNANGLDTKDSSKVVVDVLKKKLSVPLQNDSRNGIAERHESSLPKRFNSQNLDSHSEAIPPLPSSRSIKSDGAYHVDSIPSSDITQYLNYQYLNFNRPLEPEFGGSGILNTEAGKSVKGKKKTNAVPKKLTTAPKATPDSLLKTRKRGDSQESIYTSLLSQKPSGKLSRSSSVNSSLPATHPNQNRHASPSHFMMPKSARPKSNYVPPKQSVNRESPRSSSAPSSRRSNGENASDKFARTQELGKTTFGSGRNFNY